jgi:hypothetical protein
LENLDDVDINYAWETLRVNIKILAKKSSGYYEWKQHNPWFNEGCSELPDERKQARLQWLQDWSQLNLENVRH